jgi:hypothetical protein
LVIGASEVGCFEKPDSSRPIPLTLVGRDSGFAMRTGLFVVFPLFSDVRSVREPERRPKRQAHERFTGQITNPNVTFLIADIEPGTRPIW